MAIQAMWVHGNNVVAERVGGGNVSSPGPFANVDGVPWSDVVGLRQGWGCTYRGKANQGNWFHFTLPTPCWREGVRAKLQRVFILFRLFDAEARITSVHVWDGPNRLIAWDFGRAQGLRGDRSNQIYWGTNLDNANSCEFRNPPEIHFGVVVCVYVDFGPREGNVLFTSAGGDFIV